jgi:hypothetical protein
MALDYESLGGGALTGLISTVLTLLGWNRRISKLEVEITTKVGNGTISDIKRDICARAPKDLVVDLKAEVAENRTEFKDTMKDFGRDMKFVRDSITTLCTDVAVLKERMK